MDNLLKMIDFIADFIYSVFDLIWKLNIPGTNIQLIFVLIVNLAIDLLIWFILGSLVFAYSNQETKLNPNVNNINNNWVSKRE